MRYAVLVSAPVKPGLDHDVAAGKVPRRDYLDLRDALDAQIINHPYVPPRGGMMAAGMVQALNALKRRGSYDAIITDSEHVGIPLALLFKLTGTRKPHVMITHWLSPAKKRVMFRGVRVDTHIDKVITYSTAQEQVALQSLKLPRDKVERVLHPADRNFWRPLGLPKSNMICSAGLEFRDYATLIAAVDGLDLDLEIAAASPWSQRRNLTEDATLPSNVRVGKRSYDELRELYDRSKFVAVPLFDVDFQAGSLVMYEAMAMGKAVIATRTRAHQDGDILQENVTGLFVPPGDIGALRQAILRLHESPDEAERLGANARRVVEQGLNHDTYVNRMVQIARSVAERTDAPQDIPGLVGAAY